MRSTRATVLHAQGSEADRFLPEGPRAVIVEGRPALAWVNIQTAPDATGGDIHVRFWDGEHRTYAQARRPGFLFPTDRPDTLFVGREKELGLLNLTTNSFTAIATIDDTNPRTIINDGEIVPGGWTIVFGTKDVQFADPIANLYLFDIGVHQAISQAKEEVASGDRSHEFLLAFHSIVTLADQQVCSNGKIFAREGGDLLLYDIDTPKRSVVRYRIDQTKRIVSTEIVLDLREYEGFPDGMVAADDDSVIIAFYNPAAAAEGQAIRFDLRSGEPLERWTTPGSPRVTCPLLVEHEGRVQLVLTTATEGMPVEMRRDCPNAGDLFWADTTLSAIPRPEVVRIGN
jgi:sugar lactone lactonase YvrE